MQVLDVINYSAMIRSLVARLGIRGEVVRTHAELLVLVILDLLYSRAGSATTPKLLLHTLAFSASVDSKILNSYSNYQ